MTSSQVSGQEQEPDGVSGSPEEASESSQRASWIAVALFSVAVLMVGWMIPVLRVDFIGFVDVVQDEVSTIDIQSTFDITSYFNLTAFWTVGALALVVAAVAYMFAYKTRDNLVIVLYSITLTLFYVMALTAVPFAPANSATAAAEGIMVGMGLEGAVELIEIGSISEELQDASMASAEDDLFLYQVNPVSGEAFQMLIVGAPISGGSPGETAVFLPETVVEELNS